MIRYKIGKLPLVDDKGTLVGLYSFHDVNSIIGQEKQQHAVVSRDQNYRLLVGAAIGPYEFDRVEALAQAGVDVIVIDTAHGHSKGVIETVRELKQHHSLKCDIIAGNIATREGAQDLLKAGVDAVKVGIGPGSICTTRVVCGVGIPQLSAIYEVSKGINNEVPIIADGGIKYSGDVPKAIAVGADTVMMGSVFAGTRESPGEKIMRGGQMYVMYRGMGSLEALKRGKGSRERYGHHETSDSSDIIPQGIEAMVELRGSVRDIIRQFAGGLRFSLGYCGARNLAELKAKAKFVRVTNAGVREAHPHDVIIYRDAPNYSVHSSRE